MQRLQPTVTSLPTRIRTVTFYNKLFNREIRLFADDGRQQNEWSMRFGQLLKSVSGRQAFTTFLEGEYAEENMLFYSACEFARVCVLCTYFS